jgi:hypothetical protein
MTGSGKMRGGLVCLALCLGLCACTPHGVRCEGPLQPINTPSAQFAAPVRPPAGSGAMP